MITSFGTFLALATNRFAGLASSLNSWYVFPGMSLNSDLWSLSFNSPKVEAEPLLVAGYRGLNAGPDWHIHHDMYPLFGEHAGQCERDRCPVATDLHARKVTIGLDQWLAPEDCDAIAKGINKVFAAYCTAVAH